MRRESSGYRMGSHAALTVILVLSVIGFLLAGCRSSSWTSITTKRLKLSVGSNMGSFEFDSAHDILYAAIGDRGVWRCTTPDTNPAWTNTGGEVSSEDIRNLTCDPVRGVLYAAAIERGAWRYKTQANH